MSIYGNPVLLGPRWITAKKVSILPFQNLHGYDHPWPAGGGKNLADPDKIYLMSIGSGPQSWAYIDSPDGVYRTLKVDQLSAGTYTISTNLNNAYFIRYRYTASGSVVGVNIQSTTNTYTFTLADDVTDFGIAFRNTSSTEITESFTVQIELGSTATSYAPYSNVCPISGWEDCRVWVSPTPNPADGTTYQTVFGNPPGTVYGGEFNLETGVLTVNKGITLLSVSSESHISIGTTTGGVNYASILYSRFGITLSGNDPVLSSDYTWYNTSVTAAEGMIKTYSTNFRIYDNRFTSAAVAKPILDNVQVIYPLETPQTYQLTPQQISFLHNQYFGANCGPVLIKVGKS